MTILLGKKCGKFCYIVVHNTGNQYYAQLFWTKFFFGKSPVIEQLLYKPSHNQQAWIEEMGFGL